MFHRYVSSFLNGREATVKIDGAKPRTVRIGAGTPQGSVLSPTLFNLVMIGLPERLDAIEGINHTIYADDVTVWTTENTSVGEMQDRLQRAVEEVEWHLGDTGLVCSPNKLDILFHRTRKKGPLPQGVLDAHRLGVRVTTREGTRISTVSKLRVLGLWLEENGANCELVARLQKKLAATTHLVRWVANKRIGMKEHNVTLMATRDDDPHRLYNGMGEANRGGQHHHHYYYDDQNGSSNSGNINDTAGRRRRRPPYPWRS